MDGRVRIGTKLDTKGVKSGLKSIKGLIAGAGIAKAIQVSLAGFAEFETVLAKSSTLFGDVNVDSKKLQKEMLALSSATGETTKTLGEGLYTALSAGIPVTEDMGDAMAFMATNAKLAKAGFTDVDTAVGATSKVLNAYGMDVSEIGTVSNVLVGIQNKGITTVGELSQSLAQVTPIASSLGVSFEEVGASLATITAQGTPTAQATTQVRQVLAELGKTGTVASKNLEKVAKASGMSETSFTDMIESGMTLDEILALMGDYAEENGLSMIDMFSSIEAGQGALALSGDNAEKFSENLEYMSNSAGLVDEAYEKMSNTLGTQASRIKTSFQALSLSLTSTSGTMLSSVAGSIADMLGSMRTGFEENGLKGLLDNTVKAVSGSLSTIIKTAEDKLPHLFNLGINMIGEIANGIYTVLPTISGKIFGTIARLINKIFTSNKESLKTVGSNMIVSIAEGISDMMVGLGAGLRTLTANMVLIFKNTNWKAVGKDLIVQIGNGMSDNLKGLANKAWDIAKGIGNILKNAWKIATTDTTFKEVFEESFNTILDDIDLVSLDGEIDSINSFGEAMVGVFKLTGTAIMDNSTVLTDWGEGFSLSYKKADNSTADLNEDIEETGKAIAKVVEETDKVKPVTPKVKKSWKDLGDSIKEGVASSLGMSIDELEAFMAALDNADSMFDKIKIMAISVNKTIASGVIKSFGDISGALADVTNGSTSWADAMASAGQSMLGSLGGVLKSLAMNLAGIAVAKAVALDFVGAGIAGAGAIALGYTGSLLSNIGVDGGETESTVVTYDESKKQEAKGLQTQIATTEKDKDRAKSMSERATSPTDVRYYTEMYIGLGEELTELKKKLKFAQGFSNGGIVGGTSYTGDKLMAFVNSKELLFNQKQQANLSNKLGVLGSMAGGTTLVVNVLGDTFGVDDFYSKVYNGIKGMQYEGAIKTW